MCKCSKTLITFIYWDPLIEKTFNDSFVLWGKNKWQQSKQNEHKMEASMQLLHHFQLKI